MGKRCLLIWESVYTKVIARQATNKNSSPERQKENETWKRKLQLKVSKN
jgi:hypothetical protein